MRKRCVICGAYQEIEDYYSYIRTKYCKRCAAEMQRLQKAAYARELRRKTREANQITRELCAAQRTEIELLRAELAMKRAEIRQLQEDG